MTKHLKKTRKEKKWWERRGRHVKKITCEKNCDEKKELEKLLVENGMVMHHYHRHHHHHHHPSVSINSQVEKRSVRVVGSGRVARRSSPKPLRH